MAFKFSTKFKNDILDNVSVKNLINDNATGFELVLYASGSTPPASADAAEVGTKLVAYVGTDTSTDDPLDMAASASGASLTKSSTQAWKGTADATNAADYFRLQLKNDTGTDDSSSVSRPRVQGTVGTAASDFVMASTSITSGVEYECDHFSISFLSN